MRSQILRCQIYQSGINVVNTQMSFENRWAHLCNGKCQTVASYALLQICYYILIDRKFRKKSIRNIAFDNVHH